MKANDLKAHVPEMISASPVFSNIFDVQGAELDTVNNALADILDQCFIETATWGLKYWEVLIGIQTDESKPFDYRRSVIKSKIRGVGTVTVALIKSVAESYQNGKIEVIEHSGAYSIEVKFVDTKGIPPNLDDLKKAIDQIKPAHLGVTYAFIFNTYQYLTQFTYAQLQGHTQKEIREVI